MASVHFVAALSCEAQPLIEHYRLKLSAQPAPFKIYEGESKSLILSGVGKSRSAQAVRFLHEHSGSISNQIWLNVGIAGHSHFEIGEGVLAHKLTDRDSKKIWYPPLVFEVPCRTEAVLTADRPEKDYDEACAYDMEASGFYEAALRFSTSELVQCFKVISDNRTAPARKISPRTAERLIAGHLKTIDLIAGRLAELAGALPEPDGSASDVQPFLKRWHFTATQTHQLGRLLSRLKALELNGVIWPEIQMLQKSKDVLSALEDKINSAPVRL